MVWMLEELVQRIPSAVDVYVMYDIACTLVQHLKSRNREHLLKRVHFALPSFHAYGHNAACQVYEVVGNNWYIVIIKTHCVGCVSSH